MLCVLFKAASQRYAVKATLVDEVTPLTRLSPLPGAPDYLAGVMNLRGEPVPVADLNMLLCGRPSRPWASTRILAVRLEPPDQDPDAPLSPVQAPDARPASDAFTAEQLSPRPGAGRAASRRFVQGRASLAPLVGLMAERAMRAVRIETSQIRPPKAPAAAYIVGVAVTERGIIEILDPAKLLPADMLERLTATTGSA